MSSNQSEPLFVHWSPVKVLYPFLPALILVPFLLLKPNRQFGAWLMLAPFLLIAAIMAAGQWIPVQGLDDVFTTMYPYIATLAGSLCILALMTYAVPSGTPAMKFLVIPALFVVPGLVILAFTQGLARAQDLAFLAVYGTVPNILLATLCMAGRGCRDRWKLGRFTWLFLRWNFTWLFGLLLLILGIAAAWLSLAGPRVSFLNVLMPLSAVLILSISILFAIAFPFILTAFLSPLYRERLMAVFKAVHAPL